MSKRFLQTLGILFFCTAPLLAETVDKPPTSPFGIGAIVAWIVCARKKRDEIGGWLLYFYWSLYGGVIGVSLIILSTHDQFVPQYFTPEKHFPALMAVHVPDVLMVFVLAAVATYLLIVREPGMLKLLRAVLGVSIAVSVVSLVVATQTQPDQAGWDFLSATTDTAWLIYFYFSRRVKHVFVTHDWDEGVKQIYPESAPLRIAPWRSSFVLADFSSSGSPFAKASSACSSGITLSVH